MLSWYVLRHRLWRGLLSERGHCSVSVGSCSAVLNGQSSQRQTLWVLSYSLWLEQRGGRCGARDEVIILGGGSVSRATSSVSIITIFTVGPVDARGLPGAGA